MRISDWSSDVCSSDLDHAGGDGEDGDARPGKAVEAGIEEGGQDLPRAVGAEIDHHDTVTVADRRAAADHRRGDELVGLRSEARRVGKACVSTCRSRGSPYH